MSITELRNKVKNAVIKEGINVVRTSTQHTPSELILTLRIENGNKRLTLSETALISKAVNSLGLDNTLLSLHHRTQKYPPRVRYKFLLSGSC